MACEECEKSEITVARELERLKAQVGWLQAQVATNTWKVDSAYRYASAQTSMDLLDIVLITSIAVLGVWIFLKVVRAREEADE